MNLVFRLQDSKPARGNFLVQRTAKAHSYLPTTACLACPSTPNLKLRPSVRCAIRSTGVTQASLCTPREESSPGSLFHLRNTWLY